MRVEPPTKTISSTLLLSICASNNTFSTGSIHCLNRLMHKFSNLARVIVKLKSMPSCSASTSIVVVVEVESVRFARSDATFNRLIAFLLLVRSFLCFFLNSSAKY